MGRKTEKAEFGKERIKEAGKSLDKILQDLAPYLPKDQIEEPAKDTEWVSVL